MKRDVPDWLLWLILSICALAVFGIVALGLLGITDAR